MGIHTDCHSLLHKLSLVSSSPTPAFCPPTPLLSSSLWQSFIWYHSSPVCLLVPSLPACFSFVHDFISFPRFFYICFSSSSSTKKKMVLLIFSFSHHSKVFTFWTEQYGSEQMSWGLIWNIVDQWIDWVNKIWQFYISLSLIC